MEEILIDDIFEIKNGIVGTNRDVIFRLIKLMYLRSDELIQNLIGTCGECAIWLNHPHFPYYTNSEPNLKKQIITNPFLKEKKNVKINATSLTFKISDKRITLFLNVLIKRMTFECTFRKESQETPEFRFPRICIGVSTVSILSDVGKSNICYISAGLCCGSNLRFGLSSSCISCNEKSSRIIKNGWIKNEEVVTAIISQVNKESSSGYYGKMNFIRSGKKFPHTITNIPLSEGVYFGFYHYLFEITFYIMSLRKLRVPPSSVCNSDGVRCVAYDYGGMFDEENVKDEEGREILEMDDYYYKPGYV